MSDENENEGLRILGEPEGSGTDLDDVAPGRSVFDTGEASLDGDPFVADDDSLPHWSEPPTRTVPQVGATTAGAEANQSGVTPESTYEPLLMEAGSDEMEPWSDLTAAPQWAEGEGSSPPMEPRYPNEPAAAGEDFFGYDEKSTVAGGYGTGAVPGRAAMADRNERDIPMAVTVGVILAGAVLAAMWAGPAVAVVVVAVALGLAAVELLNTVRLAGYQPAVLLGLAGVSTMPLAVYWQGEAAIPVVCVLTVVFGALWYLTGVGTEGPVRGLATTVFAVAYVGVLGSYAALMLTIPTYGTGLLTAAVLVTVGYDVGGLVVGRTAGRTPLSAASPAKTVEGLIGGVLIALGVGMIMGALGRPAPVAAEAGGLWTAILFSVLAAVAAPIGDLTESLLKRDLGIKDMGAILPGHGGVLDRIDGLLFVLPTTYYAALMTDVI